MRLHLTMTAPGLPERGGAVDVWWKGTAFRVRDDTGRDHGAVLADLAEPRGLGRIHGSIEEIMDVASAAQGPKPEPVELLGDTATGAGWVLQPGDEAWPVEAGLLTPAADQIFAPDSPSPLQEVKRGRRLGRPTTEYSGTITGTAGSATYTNVVRRVVSGPYLLLDDVRDARNAGYSVVRRALRIREGRVCDADVSHPCPRFRRLV